MNNDTTPGDAELRDALKTLDPQADVTVEQDDIDRLWARIDLADAAPARRRPRRWLELALAACLGAALLGGAVTVADRYSTTGGSDSAAMAPAEPATSAMMDTPAAGEAAANQQASQSEPTSTLARDASAVVATDDLRAARDAFVAEVLRLQGTVTSESVTTGPDDPVTTSSDAAIYPSVPATPGIWLSVEVPADSYDEAVAAVTGLGDIVQFTQSTQDVGSQYAQGKARIASLKASLATLRGLMDDAASVSDVIALEDAIATRQSDLDALTAQQSYLENQIAQARISLQLMTPADAADAYDTSESWWEQVGHALAAAWAWLGRALVWTSPLWIAALVVWGWRRRRV